MKTTRNKTARPIKAAAASKTFRTALADVHVVAAEEEGGKRGPAKFDMTVYTGGAMVLAGYDLPVVIDLAGMKRTNALRANLDHVRSQRVGSVNNYQNDGSTLMLSGLCNASSASRNEVVDSAVDGYQWQASIEAIDHAREKIAKSKTVEVNGQTFKGPLYVVRDSTLTGFAFVSHGADDNTSGNIAAGAADPPPKDPTMKKELKAFIEAQGFDPAEMSEKQIAHFEAALEATRRGGGGNGDGITLQAALELEEQKRDRLNRIRDLALQAARQYPAQTEAVRNMAREAEENEIITAKDFELNLLRAMRPQSGSFTPESSSRILDATIVEAALCMNAGLPSIDKAYDPRVCESARAQFRNGLHLSELLLNAARANGEHVTSHHDVEAMLRGAFPGRREMRASGWSGINLSVVLSNVANKFSAKGFMGVDQSWRKVSAIGTANNFQEYKRAAVTGDMSFQPLGPSGEIQHGKIGEVSYGNQVDTKALLIILQRKDLVNDDMGALTSQSTRLGRGGATGFNRDFWTEFLADHATFFPTDGSKKNYFEGAGTALQSSQLGIAYQMFLDQVDTDGLPLGVEPKYLLVTTGNKVTADELYTSTNFNTGGANAKDKVPNKNSFAGKFEPVVSPYLSNALMGGAFSALAYYLVADPEDLPFIESAFLYGNQSPTLTSADADFDQFGIKIKGFWDYGIRKQEFRAAVKAKGQA